MKAANLADKWADHLADEKAALTAGVMAVCSADGSAVRSVGETAGSKALKWVATTVGEMAGDWAAWKAGLMADASAALKVDALAVC